MPRTKKQKEPSESSQNRAPSLFDYGALRKRFTRDAKLYISLFIDDAKASYSTQENRETLDRVHNLVAAINLMVVCIAGKASLEQVRTDLQQMVEALSKCNRELQERKLERGE